MQLTILLLPLLLARPTYAFPTTFTNSANPSHPPLEKRCLAHFLHKMGIHRFDDRLAACDERSAAEKDVPTRGKYAEEEWTEKQLEEKVRQGGEEGIPAGRELDKVRENWAKQEEKWAKQAEREKEERRREEAKEHREFCKQPDVKCKNP